jgi:protein transport protein SEC31
MIDDLERRLNSLFDALNCETLSKPVVEQLVVLTRGSFLFLFLFPAIYCSCILSAIAAHDRPAALAIHVDLLTRGSQTDDIGVWMSGIKQMILRV